jgi:hypothetical protein
MQAAAAVAAAEGQVVQLESSAEKLTTWPSAAATAAAACICWTWRTRAMRARFCTTAFIRRSFR